MPLRVPTATSMTTSATTPASFAAADRSRAFCSSSTAWMKLLCAFRSAIARRILFFDGFAVVIRILSTPLRDHRLRLAQLGAADADRSGGELILRDRGALVRLRVRPARQPVLLQRRLHRRDVLLHLVEIDAQRRRVELPLRDARLDRAVDRHRAHLGAGVALHRLRDPDVGGRRDRAGEERAATRT